MAEKIFVSYSHKDRKYLDGLKEVLQEHGIIEGDEVSIIDPLSGVVSVGEDIRESIKKEIQSLAGSTPCHCQGSQSTS